jgi:RNA polymerase sigma-70 factor (ECF subfamily)
MPDGAMILDVPNVTERSLKLVPAVEAPAEDLRLAAACAAGEGAAFEEIYERFGERMKSIARNQLGNVSDAEDAVQETFIKISRGAGGWQGQSSLSTWIYRILMNTCYDALRKRQRRPDESPIDESFDRAGASVDVPKKMMLRRLLDGLSEQRRTVFMLFEVEGLSHAEIAAILDIQVGYSKWLLFATKKELQEKWNRSR